MPSETHHHLSGPLALATCLSASAGFIDAFVYLRVTPVFVANMSGNLIHLGIATGEFHASAAAGALAALAGFTFGAMLGSIYLDHRVRGRRRVHAGAILAAEAIALVLLPLLISIDHTGRALTVRAVDFPVIVTASVAMGLQALALRRVGEVAVSTTHATGSVVRIAEKVVLGVRSATAASAVRRRASVTVLAAVTVAYVGGAAIATPLGANPAWLLVPAAVAAAGAVVSHRYHEHPGTPPLPGDHARLADQV